MERRVIEGLWWWAGASSEEGVRGTLTLSDDEFRLQLEGTLHGRDSDRDPLTALFDDRLPASVDRILGETVDRKDVTLEDCTLAGSGTHGKRGGGTTFSESYWPRVVCVGGSFGADERLAFDIVNVRLTSLHPWSAVSGFDDGWISTPEEGETATQSYTRPKDRSATLSDGTVVTLTFPLDQRTEGLYTSEVTLTQATRFTFTYPEPQGVDDVQRSVFVVRNLLTLGVGEAVKVTEVLGYRKPLPGESPPIGRQVDILYQHVENRSAREVPNHHSMLFLLSDIDDEFDEHITRWFERVPELGRVLDLYFSTLHVEFMYLETRFMNFVQAIEGYHRRRLNRTLYEDETFKGYKDAILKHVSGPTRRLAKKALRYANEVSLEDRVKDVLSYLADPGVSIVLAGATGTKLDADRFATRVAYRRNMLAHNLEEDSEVEDDGDSEEFEPHRHELAIFMYQLRTLIEALLLSELGFDARKIDELLERAERYRLIRAVAR